MYCKNCEESLFISKLITKCTTELVDRKSQTEYDGGII